MSAVISTSRRYGLATRLKAGVKGHATVDVEIRAGDVVGVVTGQPHGGLADVLRLADPLVRNEFHQILVCLRRFPCVRIDRGADGTGANAEHANAERRDFLGNAFHHHHDTALRRRVVDVTCPRNHVVNGADADDLARRAGNLLAHAAPLELLHRFAGAEELARQVDADDGAPLVECHFLKLRVLLETGVVDKDIDRAELLEHPGEHIFDLFLV